MFLQVMSSIQVIGASFGRTGTATLCEALNELGFPCYHMFQLIAKNTSYGHIEKWRDIGLKEMESRGATTLVEWEDIFNNPSNPNKYTACVDWPSATFYKELLKAYPNAKVVYCVRDAEKWYDSVCETIGPYPRWICEKNKSR